MAESHLEESWLVVSLPSIGILLMAFQIFYWMTLYEQTSFYVTIMQESFHDIKYYLLLILLCICSFAFAYILIDNNSNHYYN